jgi:tetratricopeptide (TPR) repeat protein
VKVHPRLLSFQDLLASLSQERRGLMRHLRECARCRTRVDGILDSRPRPLPEKLAPIVLLPIQADAEYGPAIAAAERRFLIHSQTLTAERAAAPARLAELMEHPPERREMMLCNQRRFQTWGLLERLIDHAWEQCLVAPPSAESVAKLALSLADVLDTDHYGAERIEDLRARAWGFVGNARRIRLDLQDAEEAFETAFIHLRRGTGDGLERALLLELRASLCRDQRRFPEAERLLARALRVYQEFGESLRICRVLINMTNVYEHAGTPERSIPVLHEALKLIDPDKEPRLLWNVHHNLITALAEAGRFMEAQGGLIRARPLYARFQDGPVRNRHHWVAGKIARGLRQTREAEAYLESARAGFMTEGASYDAVLVSLDLALLFAEQGRSTELKQIAEEMLTIFSSRQIHREALAALSFLYQAASAERAGLEVVAGVAAHLKRLRHEPELPFKPPAD